MTTQTFNTDPNKKYRFHYTGLRNNERSNIFAGTGKPIRIDDYFDMGYKHVVVIESPGTDQEQVAAVFSATLYDLNKNLRNDLAEANYNLEVTKREVEEANKQIDILQHDIESAEDEADFLAELLIEQIDEAEKLDAELEKNSFSVSVKLDDETLDWLRETFNQPYHVKWYTVDEHGRPVEVN